MLAQKAKNGRLFFACEHRDLCGETLRPCSSCGSDLPVSKPGKPGFLICSCCAEFHSCPECSDGWLIERKGRYGNLLGCVKFPSCKRKGKLEKTPK
ncbi:topoisomerase DNA-binding C4 zinc finger domain-containing protein [Ruegeria sp. HKCCA4008]|uniref:topoisomerase DNA-binding C4 zinc finger domain-containing protein n=1 Tax=Ruegeria sp. HKCCA4008 TaxID=2682999 RepID=UPI001488FA6B|nr:topoisomerase DNA-binding C4 zinc finger domain-containing protein [Ruegeria sp. HKCCA4008]